MPLLAIVADDLTGAADTGACFAAAGFRTVIPLASDAHPTADVVVLSTESRDLDAAPAARAVILAVSGLRVGSEASQPRWMYKKIDSTLRGHPRDELLAAMTAVAARGALVAPAFPAEGRTTIGGRQLIDGIPLEASRMGGEASSSRLLDLFQNDQGIPVRHLDLATIRTQPEEVRRLLEDPSPGIVVADAETDADLAALSQIASESPLRILCGAAGLARQMVAVLPLAGRGRPPDSTTRGARSILVVAASQHPATARQIALLDRVGIPIVRPSQRFIDDPSTSVAETATEVAAHFATQRAVVVTTASLDPSPLSPRTVASRLAQIVMASQVQRLVGGLVLTGGDVAAAVCAGLGAAAFWLHGEIAPGLPWGTLEGGDLPAVPVATKAGSFGGEDALLACLDAFTSNDH